MKRTIAKISTLIVFIFALSQATYANCTILNSTGIKTQPMADGIGVILSSSKQCPKDVFEFRQLIKQSNLSINTTMVANRGYHNPSQGSFSFFEMVSGKLNAIQIESGDFFIGHFTTVNEQDELTADQGPTEKPRLMIEAFAWDVNKELYNFYELIGDGIHNQWFYRGDSADIYADNQLLHRQPDATHPQFGNRLRCSGCHGAGGPIMKELAAPHNDWWEPERKLDFAGRKFNHSILDMMVNLVPPNRLAKSVMRGIRKLENSKLKQDNKILSLQEKLRPLFCPLEINFASDDTSNDAKKPVVQIPLEFFIDKKFISKQTVAISTSRNAYEKALLADGSHFPETFHTDADHAWLTPIKASSDHVAIDHLIEVGLINTKFVYDVLSIDMTNPTFSAARCSLLRYVPKEWSHDWQDKFVLHLKDSNNAAAHALANELRNADHTPAYHQANANKFLAYCHKAVDDPQHVKQLLLLLAQRRIELKESEISKNPLGQILEPGFRVIFPEIAVKPIPGKLRLTETCEVME